jgi:hypothetical protein
VAKWAVVPFEGGEDDTALLRLVAMLEEEARHAASLATDT